MMVKLVSVKSRERVFTIELNERDLVYLMCLAGEQSTHTATQILMRNKYWVEFVNRAGLADELGEEDGIKTWRNKSNLWSELRSITMEGK